MIQSIFLTRQLCHRKLYNRPSSYLYKIQLHVYLVRWNRGEFP